MKPKKKKTYVFTWGKGLDGGKMFIFFDCELENGSNKHKNRKIKKLRRQGKNPHSKILVDDLNDEIAYRVEKAVLEREEVFSRLTNILQEGRGVNHTKETRRKISEKNSGENHHNYGKRITTGRKLNKTQVAEIKWILQNADVKHSEFTKRYPVQRNAIGLIGRNITWKEVDPEKPKEENWWREAKGHYILKLTEEEAREVLWLTQNTSKSYPEIAEDYPIERGQVGRIKRKDQWQNITPKRPKEYE